MSLSKIATLVFFLATGIAYFVGSASGVLLPIAAIAAIVAGIALLMNK